MIDPLSQTSYFLECLYEDKVLAFGTCFFVKKDETCFLITNWHNATGLNPITGEFLSQHELQPTHFKIQVFVDIKTMSWTDLVICLYEQDKPLWFEHPQFGNKVDVVAIQCAIPNDMQVFPVEQFIQPFNEKTEARVKDDVYILGFPFGLTGGGGLPLWKRASIASEPIVDIDDLPKMYVDTASRSGMSGSPVIYMEKRPIIISEGDPNTATKVSTHFMQFIGVYSGRIGADDEFKAQLGIVWKHNVIEKIIENK